MCRHAYVYCVRLGLGIGSVRCVRTFMYNSNDYFVAFKIRLPCSVSYRLFRVSMSNRCSTKNSPSAAARKCENSGPESGRPQWVAVAIGHFPGREGRLSCEKTELI